MNDPHEISLVSPEAMLATELVLPAEMGGGRECDSAALNVAWESVSWFRVSCKGVHNARTTVYANGYQCVQIDVDIIAKNHNNESVALSPSQLSSIHLINYVGGGAVPAPYYVENTKKNDFIHDLPVYAQQSAGDAVEEDVLQSDVQRRTLWIHTYGGVGSALRLAARIVTPAGIPYTTNTPNPGPGKFDSSVTLEPMVPLAHRASELESGHQFYGTVGQRDGYIFKAVFKDPKFQVYWYNLYGSGYFYIGKSSGRRRYYDMPKYDESTRTLVCHHGSQYTFRNIPTRCLRVVMIADAHDDGPNMNGIRKADVFDQHGNRFTLEWYPVNDGKQIALRDA